MDNATPVPPSQMGAGPYPGAGDPNVGQAVGTLSQQEMQMLRAVMTPELGSVLAKILGPQAVAPLEPFMVAPDLQAAQQQAAAMQAPAPMQPGGIPPMPPQGGLSNVFAG